MLMNLNINDGLVHELAHHENVEWKWKFAFYSSKKYEFWWISNKFRLVTLWEPSLQFWCFNHHYCNLYGMSSTHLRIYLRFLEVRNWYCGWLFWKVEVMTFPTTKKWEKIISGNIFFPALKDAYDLQNQAISRYQQAFSDQKMVSEKSCFVLVDQLPVELWLWNSHNL